MADYTVLRDIHETLRQLLRAKVPELADDQSILFDSPAAVDEGPAARLSVFLYQVAVNSELRNSLPSAVGDAQMHSPPLGIDLFYLFTPHAKQRDTEFVILERVMRLFHDVTVLRGDVLQGKLAANGNDEIRIISQALSLDELNKLWSIFPNKPYKLSVAYQLTPVRIASEQFHDVHRVKEGGLKLDVHVCAPHAEGTPCKP